MKLGQQIKEHRGKARMSLQTAAYKASMSISQWWKIEQDEVPNPGIETIRKMKKVLGIK